MEEAIFRNCFTLKYKKSEIEDEYQKKRDARLLALNRYFMIFLVLLNIFSTILLLKNTESEASLFWILARHTGIISTSFYSVLILICLFSKNLKILRWCHYLAYLMILISYANIYVTLSFHIKVSSFIMYVLVIIEMQIRISSNIFLIQSFLEIFILNSINCGLLWLVYIPVIDPQFRVNSTYSFLIYTITYVFLIGFSYLIENQLKNTFYFQYTHLKKLEWLTNVFENMNTGFLSIRGLKITYMNSFLQNKLSKIKLSQNKTNLSNPTLTEAALLVNENKHIETSRTCSNQQNIQVYNQEDTNSILSILLMNLNIDYIDSKTFNYKFSEFLKECSLNSPGVYSQKNQNLLISKFVKCIKDIPGINNFVLLGDKKIDIDESENYYEIYCRFNHSPTTGDELDFLLNDVTRTKLNEKQNAEFKYKTLFLSKVAHEFKNPLICITELIHQLSENLILNNEAIKTISQIKSMSNFLLVLVKDLNYFSETQIGKNIVFENKEIDLDELLNFCKEITDSLILKSNKANSVKFNITKKETPIKFIVDEWRLKQVLLNILSNAVKFTNYGEINLDVILEKNLDTLDKQRIKFCVSDTGVGIKEENFDNLFGPFSKGNNNDNDLGSGLGLSVASEISGKLGEKLQFSSTYGEGSRFWFSIPYSSPRILSNFNINIFEPDCENTSKENYCLNLEIISERQADEQFDITVNSGETKVKEFFPTHIRDFSISGHSRKKSIKSINSNSLSFQISQNIGSSHIRKKFSEKTLEKNLRIFSVLDIFNPDLFSCIRFPDRLKSNSFSTPSYERENKTINLIIADDENFIRQSSIRILQTIAEELNIRLNIIEAEDGVECLYVIYKCISQGVKISMIFSDENMTFIKGSTCSELLGEVLNSKNISCIPFYLVTAYDNTMINMHPYKYITEIVSKPLSKSVAKNLILNCK